MHPALGRTDHRPWPLPSRPWIGRQRWCDLLFAHWPVPLSALAPLVPAGLEVQEFDGTSWVGLVPFRMEDVMLRGLPGLPWLSRFAEMNLRLYVVADGKPGVWFVSLDAARLPAVWAARRFLHLPYFLADMQVSVAGRHVTYRSLRTHSNARVALRVRYEPTSAVFEARPGTLEHFLTARYCLYTQYPDKGLRRLEIHHPPWPLQEATLEVEENTAGTAQGIALDGRPSLVHFSRRIDVITWTPERI
jgi:uncharacterized protein YqjF (DUF2071 family)